MANDFEITFHGLEQLQARLNEVRARYPYKEEEILLKLGATLKASSKEKTPLGKHKKHLRNQYKLSKVQYDRDGSFITMTNTSPHFHLVEKGHQIVGKNGQEHGFAQGIHMVETSMIELEQTLSETLGTWLDSILGSV
ncbi:HK97 gp10 family phage protein [Desulfosporosinus sp. SB140]|uniref:HK97 gp10 family phage protein n=1 Tax=Desulfosporosinus paludis TaxID=3115649 RepID=UPI00388E4EE9